MLKPFNWRGFDAYLFDIDGTLLNSRDGVHYNSFHTALREVYGCQGRIDDVPVHGNTDIGILRAALHHHGFLADDFEERLPAATEMMCAEVTRTAGDFNAEVCPSTHELLSSLRDAGKLLGVVTGNLERIGWLKLQQAGLRQFFEFGSFSDRHEQREDIFRHGAALAHQLRGAQCSICFVGDTPNDIRAAATLALPVIAVATGTYTQEQLRQHTPTLCLSSFADLLDQQAKDADADKR